MKRKDTYAKLKGTVQAGAVIERMEELIANLDTVEGINIHDMDVKGEVLGRQLAKRNLNIIIRELKKDETVEKKYNYD